jgi:hypothetical protein
MINLSYKGNKKGLMEYIGEQICEFCHGEGILYFLEMDQGGNWADTGMKTCQCKLIEPDYDSENN